MAISEKIKEYRVKRGMTQAQLAELVGVTPQAISKWETGKGYPDISAICPLADALSITTDELLEHKNPLGELNKKIPVTIELGLQTIHNHTARLINRGYELDIFDDCVKRLNKHNIEIVVHIINGLPLETKEMMLDTVKYLNNLDIHGIKIHSLFILKNTKLAEMFLNKEFYILSMDEYVDITTEQLAIIRDDIVIHRINGDAPRDLLIEPLWSLKKLVVMNEIDKKMKEKNYYQGCKMTK